ncbi:hypothetical protein Ahy_A09g043490 isoform A [Arachis hypogaea]|uniref:Uncharacterized protein n=1 Tax=Arachis hypogaea TaxID=3818 RepID=A0A445BID9_ARAHY|nr:hypothetical protein Ahy_A09g043490 isoform A [Arachis hypogaea]
MECDFVEPLCRVPSSVGNDSSSNSHDNIPNHYIEEGEQTNKVESEEMDLVMRALSVVCFQLKRNYWITAAFEMMKYQELECGLRSYKWLMNSILPTQRKLGSQLR